MDKFNISENIEITEIEVTQSQSKDKHVNQKPNAYYLRNSQYLKKEERDPALVRSYELDGYLVPITNPEVLEKYQERFSYELVYDPILDKPLPIRKLLSLKGWKKDEQRLRFLEINERCQQLGIKVKEGKNHPDPVLKKLLSEYEEVEEQLRIIDRELNYQDLMIAKEEHWEDPIPLPEGLSPVGSFSQDMLPEALRNWIMDIADRMQIPPDFSAASCTVVLSSLIGRKFGIYPKRKDDWLVIPNLWGAIVGRPSLLKSPAIAEIMKPLDNLVDKAFNQYQSKTTIYERELMLLDAKKSAFKDHLKQSLKKAAKSGSSFHIEQLQQEDIGKPAVPILKRYKTEDSTIEKIGEILKDNPQGILIHRDELSGWLNSLDKYGHEGDRAFYLEAWNGAGSFIVDRIGRGTLHIPSLCLSILGGIQPGPLSSYIYQASKGGAGDDGLLQRFQLLVWPDAPKKWKNVDRFPDNQSKQRAYKIYQALDALPFENPEPMGLRFSNEAQEAFDEWRNQLELRLRSGQLIPSLESHLAKYRSLMPSLALIFYLVECLDKNIEFSSINLAATNQAIKWCIYLESHANRLYSSAECSQLDSARALTNKIKNGEIQDGCSLRDIYYAKHWARLSNRKEVEDAVNILEDLGWLRVKKIAGNGRPRATIQLHPLFLKNAIL